MRAGSQLPRGDALKRRSAVKKQTYAITCTILPYFRRICGLLQLPWCTYTQMCLDVCLQGEIATSEWRIPSKLNATPMDRQVPS
jgi:hypothetical protein